MVELTGELTYVVPFMCAVLAAKLVGDSITPSIYDAHSTINGYAPIEEQQFRLNMAVGDIATPLDVTTCLVDAAAAISAARLTELAGEGPMVVRPPQEGDPSSSADVLIVASRCGRRGDTVGTTDGPPTVLGIIERPRLRRWLACKNLDPDAACSFEAQDTNDAGDSSSERFQPGSPSSRPPVTSVGDMVETSVANGSRHLFDVSELVDMSIAKVSPCAPLLTAYCVFNQKPNLKYCVVIGEHKGGWSLGVLRREEFEAALTEERFPLRHPLHDASVWGPADFASCATRSAASEKRASGLTAIELQRLPTPDESTALREERHDPVSVEEDHPAAESTEDVAAESGEVSQ